MKITKSELNIKNEYDTVILIERHGESLGNANREFLGHTNKDLSQFGYDQANRTAQSLADFKIDVIYSSDLIRAHNTVLPHATLRGLKIIDSRALREIYAGEWEGMSVEKIIEEYHGYYHDVWRAKFGVCRIPGGEAVPEVAERIHSEILEIASANKGKTILIGAHAAAIRAFFGKITHTPADELADAIPFPTNASVSVVYFDGENLIPGVYSYDKHLLDLMNA